MKPPEEYAPGYEFRDAWRSDDASLAADAIAFWERLGVLPSGTTAAERAKELVAVAYKDGAVAGVMTAEVGMLKQVRTRLAMIRSAVDPAHRRANIARALTLQTYQLLERWRATHPEEKLGGLGAFVENREILTSDYMRRPYWPESRFILAGYMPDGRQIRIAWFPDFRLPAH
jgi:GNAT superfamily N-acetyltransferase